MPDVKGQSNEILTSRFFASTSVADIAEPEHFGRRRSWLRLRLELQLQLRWKRIFMTLFSSLLPTLIEDKYKNKNTYFLVRRVVLLKICWKPLKANFLLELEPESEPEPGEKTGAGKKQTGSATLASTAQLQ